jgi:benzoyl-CoA reductase/2-hydroxyglutaryl-CoA dehydratase subunit BcrC/BadD/HgdB
MKRWLIYFYFTLIAVLGVHFAQAQLSANTPKWGPNDTLTVTGIIYEGEVLPFKELEMVYVSNLLPEELAKAVAKYNRLRNAVYVTYPFARTAGVTLNDVNRQLTIIKAKGDRKKYIKSREKELKDKFSDPLTNLSVYQGRVLMKLINRQTGNNCYEIIKEFKGNINARMYQTVAFFFGSSLKQDYDMADATDRQIENIVREIDGVWYNNPNKPGIR